MSNYKASREYKSRRELLRLLSLKIIDEDNKLYLVDLNDTFRQRIYSESFTDIKKGLIKIKDNNKIQLDSNDSRRIFNHVIYNLQMKQCGWCGKSFKPKSNAEKYCSKHCRKYAKINQDRNNKRKQRKNPNYYEKRVGTVNLSPHRNNDFEKEEKIVKNERIRTLGNKSY